MKNERWRRAKTPRTRKIQATSHIPSHITHTLPPGNHTQISHPPPPHNTPLPPPIHRHPPTHCFFQVYWPLWQSQSWPFFTGNACRVVISFYCQLLMAAVPYCCCAVLLCSCPLALPRALWIMALCQTRTWMLSASVRCVGCCQPGPAAVQFAAAWLLSVEWLTFPSKQTFLLPSLCLSCPPEANLQYYQV